MAIRIRTPNTNISAGSINTNFLKDANVTTAKIADDAVTLAKISTTGALNEQVLQYNSTSGNIEWADSAAGLEDGAVTTAKLADGAVTYQKFDVSGNPSHGQVMAWNGGSSNFMWSSASTFDPTNAGAISNTGNILPSADNSWDIGAPGAKYNDMFAETFQGTAVLADDITMSGSAGDILTYQQSNKWVSSTNNTVRNFKLDGSASGITAPVLKIETDNSGWNRPQISLEDSNGLTTSIVGQHNTSSDFYQLNYTLDPNNTHGRTGATTFAGDYFMSFDKNYSDQSAIKMEQRVFGANGGFNIKVFDDFNSGGGNQYHAKPIRLQGEKIELHTDSSGTPFGSFTETLTVDSTRVTINNLTRLHNASSDPSSPLEGDVYYNTGTDRIKLYTGAGWVTLSVD